MSKFAAYNIDLNALSDGVHTFDYRLDNEYFKRIDSPEVQQGELAAKVQVRAGSGKYDVELNVDGKIVIPCNRCLDDMLLPITANDKLRVKLGEALGEDGDTMVLPEHDAVLNVAWFLYELIVLSIPIKHVHAPGGCNKTMAAKLHKHLAVNLDEEDEEGMLLDEEENMED